MSPTKGAAGAFGFLVFFFFSLFLLGTKARAESFAELVTYLAHEHNLIKAAEDDVQAARQRARVALGDWFPTLDVSASYGHEDQLNPTSDNTSQVTRQTDLKVSQLLWDFGKTNAALRRAGLVLDQAIANRDAVRQDLLRRGVTAVLNVIRHAQVTEFAKQSEANIKRQTDLESALVQAGRGFSTDVLQAKARLAGAESRRVVAEGGYERAKNEYRAIFEREPLEPLSWVKPKLSYLSLPRILEDAIETAFEHNPGLKSATINIRIAQEDVNATQAESFFPKLQGVIQRTYQKDFEGTSGFERDTAGKVELSFPFNLGFTALNTLRASKLDQSSTTRRVADTKDLVEQQTRDAWIDLLTARQNTASLRNQAEIVTRFLEDARKERKAGRRSLLDVLDGETQLINAQSDAVSAEIDEAIASYALLTAMGLLSEGALLDKKSEFFGPRQGPIDEAVVSPSNAAAKESRQGILKATTVRPDDLDVQSSESPSREAIEKVETQNVGRATQDSLSERVPGIGLDAVEPAPSEAIEVEQLTTNLKLDQVVPTKPPVELQPERPSNSERSADGESEVGMIETEAPPIEAAEKGPLPTDSEPEPVLTVEPASEHQAGKSSGLESSEESETEVPNIEQIEAAPSGTAEVNTETTDPMAPILDFLASVGGFFDSSAENSGAVKSVTKDEPSDENRVTRPDSIDARTNEGAHGEHADAGLSSEPQSAVPDASLPDGLAPQEEETALAQVIYETTNVSETKQNPVDDTSVVRSEDRDPSTEIAETAIADPVIEEHDGDEISYAGPSSSRDESSKAPSPESHAKDPDKVRKKPVPVSGNPSFEAKSEKTSGGTTNERSPGKATADAFLPVIAVARAEKVNSNQKFISDTYVSLLTASGGNLNRPASSDNAASTLARSIATMKSASGPAANLGPSSKGVGFGQVLSARTMPKKISANPGLIHDRVELLLKASGGTLSLK